MITLLKKFERLIIHSLIVMMMVVILLTTIELAWLIIKDIISPPIFILENPTTAGGVWIFSSGTHRG